MLGERIKKLILIRLLFATLLLYAPKVFLDAAPVAFYGAASAISLLTVLYVLWYLMRRWARWLAVTQILGDILLETYLLLFTGGAESIFSIFYVLSILSVALVVGERKIIFLTTAFACVGYLGASCLAYGARLNPLMPSDPVYFLYGVTARIGIFVAVGQLCRYLSGTVLELQNQLKLSERLSLLGEVISKISHEIRNPLAAIRTAAEVLRDSLREKLSPPEERMMSIVDAESNRLTQTFQRILSYAKQVQPNPKMLLLEGLIERTLALVRLNTQVQSNGVVVEKKYDPLHTRLYADEEQILSALLNLIINACQAMPQGGTLRISAEEKLRGTTIDLQDSGGGIPREKLKDLFLPFKSTKKGGTGLGLAEVHKIVTLHEGTIEVESQSGKGTIFHLYFPKP